MRKLSKNTPIMRVNITMPIGLVALVDQAAEEDFTSRSDVIRQALLEYVRPVGSQTEDMTRRQMVQLLQRRALRASLNEIRPNLHNYH